MARDPLLDFLRRPTRSRFEALVRDTHTDVSHAAWRILGDVHLAEDVAQEVYMKALEEDWDPQQIRSGRGWLATTAVQLARTRLRSLLRRKTREEEAAVPRSDAPDEDLEAIRDAVHALPGDLRQCVELRYFAALEVKEVAETLDLTPRAVNKRLQSARERLAKRLSPSALGVVAPVMDGLGTPPVPATPVGRPDWLPSICEQALARGHLTAGTSAATAARVGLALVLASGLVWHLVLRDAGEAPPRHGADDPAATASTDAPPRKGPVLLGGAPAPASAPLQVEPGDPIPEPGGASKRASLARFSLQLRVLDHREGLIREGTISLEPARPADFERYFVVALQHIHPESAQRGIDRSSLRWFDAPIRLEAHNPLSVDDLPGELEGIRFRVAANVPGFATGRLPQFEVRAGGSREVLLRLVPARTVEVRVVDDETSEPVPAAEVESTTELARRPNIMVADAAAPVPGRGVGDEAGLCDLGGLGPGAHALRITRGGYVPSEIRVPADALSVEVRLRPVRGGAPLRVRVIDPDGRPVVDMRVRLGYGAGTRMVRTDEDGVADFGVLPPLRGWVVIPPQDWAECTNKRGLDFGESTRHQDISIEAGIPCNVVLGYPRGTSSIAVEVVDEDGAPFARAQVEVRGPKRSEARTDDEGRLRFDALPAGEYEVRARWSPGPLRSTSQPPWHWSWTWSDWPVAEGDLLQRRIVVGRARVDGRVVSADGDGLAGIRVFLEGAARASTETDQTGAFRIEGVAAGAYRLLAFDPQRGDSSPKVPIQVERDQPVPPVKLVLVAGGAGAR